MMYSYKFDNDVFLQICGIAMGKKLAPALTTIYIGDLEETLTHDREKKRSGGNVI